MSSPAIHNTHYAHYLVSTNLDFVLYPEAHYCSLPPVVCDEPLNCVPRFRRVGDIGWLEVCKFLRPSTEYNNCFVSGDLKLFPSGVGVDSYERALCEMVALVRRLLYRALRDPLKGDLPPFGYEFSVELCDKSGVAHSTVYPNLVFDLYGVRSFGSLDGRDYLFSWQNPKTTPQKNLKERKTENA